MVLIQHIWIISSFAFVVMYDAAGVRRAAGKQAKLLNKIVQTPGLSKLKFQKNYKKYWDTLQLKYLWELL